MTAAVAPRAMSYSEYLTLPEDSRAELLDGFLVVSAFPMWAHQRAALKLAFLLDASLPPGLAVNASSGWHIDERWEAGPDVIVVPDADHGPRFTGVPALVVEILSSNRRTDLVTKRRGYALGGAPYYWVVDLDVPSVTVLELDGPGYREAVVLGGDQRAPLPYAGGTLTFAPGDLLDR